MRQTKHRWTSMTGQKSGRMTFKLTLMSWRYGARRQIHLQNLPFQNCDARDKKEDEVMACTLTADEAFSKLIEVSLASTQECTWGCGRVVTVKGLLLVPCSICECEIFASIPALLPPPALHSHGSLRHYIREYKLLVSACSHMQPGPDSSGSDATRANASISTLTGFRRKPSCS